MTTQSKSAARAIADVVEGTILATVDIDVPPERVFHALTASDEVVKWWGSDEDYRTTAWRADVRVGGAWRADGIGNDGSAFHVEGEFLEVDAPKKLVLTWAPAWDAGAVTTLTYRLDAIPTGTRLVLRHTGFAGRAPSCEAHAAGWEKVLGWLKGHVAPVAPAPEKTVFVCRLLGPRPTFPFDMTPDEAALMKGHAAYWAKLVEDGTVLVLGPVNDPKGVWGLGIVRAADAPEVEALQAQDPVIRDGVGFRYENSPMMRALVHAR